MTGSDVVEQLAAMVNERDLPSGSPDSSGLRSEQPAHPGRAFVERAQMEANWTAMFDGIPDFHAELVRSVQDAETV
jgi:hypothetical protein